MSGNLERSCKYDENGIKTRNYVKDVSGVCKKMILIKVIIVLPCLKGC